MLDAQLIAVNGKAEKPSYRTSWPKWSKSITMCRPLDSQNSLLHGIALREKWLKSHLPLPTQMVLGLLSTSLLNRWKGDEHTQGVSLSPRMVRNADIGYRSSKILADMSCSFNLQPNTGRIWFSTSEARVEWAERISAVIFSSFWRLLKENFKTWTSTAKPRTQNDTNDTNQKFGRSRDLKLVSLWHKWGWQKQRKAHGNERQWALCEARGEHRNAGYPYDVLSKSKHRIWMSSFSKHVPHNVCHNASVSFCNLSAWGQMLSDAKSVKQVGQRMLGLWMVECSKVATQHKRPLARLHALFIVDPGWTKVQEMEALIWPQSALWTN